MRHDLTPTLTLAHELLSRSARENLSYYQDTIGLLRRSAVDPLISDEQQAQAKGAADALQRELRRRLGQP